MLGYFDLEGTISCEELGIRTTAATLHFFVRSNPRREMP